MKEPVVTVTESLPSDTDTGEEGSVGVSVVISNDSPGALSEADNACPVHLRLPSGQLQKNCVRTSFKTRRVSRLRTKLKARSEREHHLQSYCGLQKGLFYRLLLEPRADRKKSQQAEEQVQSRQPTSAKLGPPREVYGEIFVTSRR